MSDKCLCQQEWDNILFDLNSNINHEQCHIFGLLTSRESIYKYVNITVIVQIDTSIYGLFDKIKKINDIIQKVSEGSYSELNSLILLINTDNYLVPKICDKCAKNFVNKLGEIISEKNLLAFIEAHNARDQHIPKSQKTEEHQVFLRWNVEYRTFLKKYSRRYNNVFDSPLNKELEDVFEKRKTFMTSPVDASIENKYEFARSNLIQERRY